MFSLWLPSVTVRKDEWFSAHRFPCYEIALEGEAVAFFTLSEGFCFGRMRLIGLAVEGQIERTPGKKD